MWITHQTQIRYHDKWNLVLREAISYPVRLSNTNTFGGVGRCTRDICFCVFRVVCRMTSVQSLQNLDEVFATSTVNGPKFCKDALSKMKKWRADVEVLIGGIPAFSTFCHCPTGPIC